MTTLKALFTMLATIQPAPNASKLGDDLHALAMEARVSGFQRALVQAQAIVAKHHGNSSPAIAELAQLGLTATARSVPPEEFAKEPAVVVSLAERIRRSAP